MRPYTLTFLLLLASIFSLGQNKDYEKGLKAFEDRNYSKAASLLQPFAESGDAQAEFVVALCYLSPESKMRNDTLVERYLLHAAGQFNAKAMSLLSYYYFQKGVENEKLKVQALVWAEIAAAYEPALNATTTTRHLIRQYIDESALGEAEKILTEKKATFDKINLESFRQLNKQAKTGNENSDKTRIPENNHNLMIHPYRDWVYRWKLERIECETMYYTAQVAPALIDSTKLAISNSLSFEIHFLYRDSKVKKFDITKAEQAYLLQELEALKSHRWEPNLFPYSTALEQTEIQPTFDKTEKQPTEKEKNMCSIVYTFSKPIFTRNGTIALFLDQKRYRTNYTQLEFGFYKLENNRWQLMARAYSLYESAKQ